MISFLSLKRIEIATKITTEGGPPRIISHILSKDEKGILSAK